MKKALLTFAFVVVGILFAAGAMATHVVTGKVTGPDGGPLIGASVLLKQTTTGTITDIDGNYVIQVPDNLAKRGILQFTFIGLEGKEIKIDNRNVINVQLQEGGVN